MKLGELREEIIDICPSDFNNDLTIWIDKVEGLIVDTLPHFEICGIEDLHKIEDGIRAIEEVKDGLY